MSAATLPPPGMAGLPAANGHLPRPAPAGPPAMVAIAELWRLSRADYRRMLDVGILQSGDPVELLDGLLVRKMPINRPHVIATRRVTRTLSALLPAGWTPLPQGPVALDEHEPEPDVCVIRGDADDYRDDHPTPADVPLIVEVSDTSIGRDQGWKRSIYARNAVATYWIVNVVGRVLEVYSQPVEGGYARAVTLTAGDRAEVVLDGVVVGTVAVADLLP